MKKLVFSAKIIFLFLIALLALYIKNKDFLHQVYEAYHYDTFNVFHWQNIRFTSAEPNKNFVKTKYIIHNPKKFNAFIFGSSRVGNLPIDRLPKELNGKELRWYNMTYSEGVPSEHLLSLKTFLEHGVKADMVIVGFDNISMYASIEQHKQQLLRMPYQFYEKNPKEFRRAYLQITTDDSIKNQIDNYDRAAHKESRSLFYSYGGNASNFSLTENPDMARFVSCHPKESYTQKNAQNDIGAIAAFCREHGIKLVLLTNPIYETTYQGAVEDGYLDFLRKVSEQCEFYNFSSLNNFTQDPRYYFESSHYRPALGLLVEKMLFGTDEERKQIRRDADDELWGIKVNAENVDFVLSELQKQINTKN